MAYQAVEEIQVRCEKENIPFWKAVQLEDCEENGITEEESWQQMTLMWTRMKESVDAYDPRDPEVVWWEKKAVLWMNIARMKSRFVEILFQRSLQMR